MKEHNNFQVLMYANQRVMMLKQKIIEHHGRVSDICLYDAEPSKEDLEAIKAAKLAKN